MDGWDNGYPGITFWEKILENKKKKKKMIA
jgi:hypothetical protein